MARRVRASTLREVQLPAENPGEAAPVVAGRLGRIAAAAGVRCAQAGLAGDDLEAADLVVAGFASFRL